MMKRILYILAIALSILACTDDIDKSNRFTFTGETMADFLLNRSEKYSHFITLLKRAELFSLLQTYGQYTLFLPDNDAVEKYLHEQDSLYWATKDSENPIYIGITSPLIEELSDSMANVIARNHLVEGNHLTASFDDGALPHWNFYDRYLGISYEPTEESFYIKVNSTAAIIDSDNEVENGVIHIVNNVVDVTSNPLPSHIAKYKFFSLFTDALNETAFADSLLMFVDLEYKPISTEEVTPQKKYYRYTGFLETDDVFNANGIYTLDDLKAFAEKWYGTEDKENPRSPKNALYKFVAYHFVPREMPYNIIIPLKMGSWPLEEYITPGNDCYDYFETMLGTLMKVIKPLSSSDGKYVYINRPKENKVYNNEMRRHLNVRLIEPTEFAQAKDEYSHFNPIAMNGIIQPIDKVLVYNEDEMVGNILNERLRFDILTLLPELSCNDIRYSRDYNIKKNRIPYTYCKNIRNNSNSSNYFSCTGELEGYMSDYLLTDESMFDISFRLPPIPPRTYEIRMSIFTTLNDYGSYIMQPYIDGKVCSLPIELSANLLSTGWVDDRHTLDNGVENDKHMRGRGWMKAPDSYRAWNFDEGIWEPARRFTYLLRRILTRQYLTSGEHWIRFKLLSDEIIKGCFDYIELVPLHIVSDPLKPEDRH